MWCVYFVCSHLTVKWAAGKLFIHVVLYLGPLRYKTIFIINNLYLYVYCILLSLTCDL